ncbi:DUF6449 domain-containing protein [Cytobacillus sp. FJAT-54145]|uniref:DUF6449 domain-containing protein n=1 Tax=Cytobacillus spartinae TaxID=3299023 RepID=A0ABW6K7R2_9BACI
MQSKISLIKSEFFKQISRNIGWISIIYFLTLVFAIPLDILMTVTNEHKEFWVKDNLFQYNVGLQIILMISIPVLLAVFLFRYLQVKQSSDLYHSLPIKRTHIFHQYTLIGLLFLIIPVIATAIIVHFQHITWDLQPYFSVGDIYYWAGIMILINIIVYMGAVFIGMVTGLSIVHGALTYIFLLLPLGLLVLITANLQYFLYGFPQDYFLNSKMEYFSPLVITEQLNHQKVEPLVIWLYLMVSIVLYGLSVFLYKKRKLEAVSQALVFPILQPIFKFGTTFCSAFLVALYLGETQNQSFAWLIAGYIIGSFIGYIVAEMVLQKTWRVFGSFKSYFIYVGALAIILVALHLDVTKYEDKVPERSEIKSVHLSEHAYYYYSSDYQIDKLSLEEDQNIKFVQEFHKAIISNKNDVENESRNGRAFFAYELENGKNLVREYYINKELYKEFIKPIHESIEYKEANNEIFRLKEDVEFISFNPAGPTGRHAVISEPEDINEVISILKDEIYAASYDEMYNNKGFQSHISMKIDDQHGMDILFKPSYKKLEAWLKEKGLAEKAMVVEEDISHALVVEVSKLEMDKPEYAYSNEEIFNKMMKSSDVLELKDRNELQIAMDQSIDYYMVENERKKRYLVAFYFKNENYPVIRSFEDEFAPDFVKQFFQ